MDTPPAYLEEGRYIELNNYDPDTNTSETGPKPEEHPRKTEGWYLRNRETIHKVGEDCGTVICALGFFLFAILCATPVVLFVVYLVTVFWKWIAENKKEIDGFNHRDQGQQKRDGYVSLVTPHRDVPTVLSVPGQSGKKKELVDRFWSETLGIQL